MDADRTRDMDFTPEFNSDNFAAVLHMAEEYSTLPLRGQKNLLAILQAKHPRAVFLIRKNLEFLYERDILNESNFELLIHTPQIEQLDQLFNFLARLPTNNEQLSTFITEITEATDAEKLISRLHTLKTQGIINGKVKRVAMLMKNFGHRVPKINSHHATEIRPRFVLRPRRTSPHSGLRAVAPTNDFTA